MGRTATPSSKSSTENPSDHVLVGRVVKPHGLQGEVLVRVFSDNPARFAPGSQLFIGSAPENARAVRVDTSRADRDRLLVHLDGYLTLESAETLRDKLLFVPAGALGRLGEDEFWEHELVGMTVFHKDGTVLGEITEVLERAAQDLWSVHTVKGEVLFPAAKQLVVSVDVDGRTAVIDPPEGLFD